LHIGIYANMQKGIGICICIFYKKEMETTVREIRNQHKGEAYSVGERFVTYVRTLQFMKTRLKGIDEGEGVHISQKEIEQRFFIYPRYIRKQELEKLIRSGELAVSEKISDSTGRKMLQYKALRAGAMDLHLLRPEPKQYGVNHSQMKENLKLVTLAPGAPSTPYFDMFLKYKDELTDLFFTVDDFAKRVHTPITNFHRTHRPNILLDGCTTTGLDVTTMQPLLLGRILYDRIGLNDFSEWINTGKDIYIMLKDAAGLDTRDQGKKRFFEILFAKPNESLSELFGRADWITWINSYKRKYEPLNPHSRHKPHSNLAWLLQSTEVKVMRKVWESLNVARVPFLSVHDEIIVRDQDRHQAESIFRKVLDQEFTYYQLNVKERAT
jgi:hypothetical protein